MASAVTDLPVTDDIIWEILLLLPPKSLLRCRAVCKAWRNLASDRGLLLAHHRRQPSQPLFYCPRDAGGGAIDFRLEAVDLLRPGSSRSVVRFTEYEDHRFHGYGQGQLTFHGSCGGLLLVSFADSLYICNPATRQSAPLPPLPAGEIAGLYEHHPTGEYRVLYHRGEGLRKSYYVLTVGSGDREGRSIGRPASSLSPSVDAELRIGPSPACWESPVLLHGNLHWPPQGQTNINDDRMLMLVFDIVAEVFRWIPGPPIGISTPSTTTLFEIDGMLALSTRDAEHPPFAHLWLLQDYGRHAWVPTSSFRFEVVKVIIANFGDAPALAASFIVSRQGDVLVECSDRVLHFHYDMDARLVATFRWLGRYLMFTGLVLRETLIPHVFFHINCSASVDAPPPPFFQGL